jgi:hypothetical protein
MSEATKCPTCGAACDVTTFAPSGWKRFTPLGGPLLEAAKAVVDAYEDDGPGEWLANTVDSLRAQIEAIEDVE